MKRNIFYIIDLHQVNKVALQLTKNYLVNK